MKKIIAIIITILLLSSCSTIQQEEIVQNGEDSNLTHANDIPDEQISDIIPDNNDLFTNEQTLPLDSSYVCYDLGTEAVLGNYILEIEDIVLIYTTAKNIVAFNISTGEKLYSLKTNCSDNIGYMEKTNHLSDYDYYITDMNGIHYFNSCEPASYNFIELPTKIINDIHSSNTNLSYFIYNNKIVWESPEGIKMMDLNTTNEHLVLPNDKIENGVLNIIEEAPLSGRVLPGASPYKYFNPCFIDNGTKIVSQISSSDYTFFAVIIYDIEKEQILSGFSYSENYSPNYPLDDKLISLKTEDNLKLIDANQNTSSDYFCDYNEIFYAEQGILASYSFLNDYLGLEIYTCLNKNLSSDRTLINHVTDDDTVAVIRHIGQKNIYLEIADNSNLYVCSVPIIY